MVIYRVWDWQFSRSRQSSIHGTHASLHGEFLLTSTRGNNKASRCGQSGAGRRAEMQNCSAARAVSTYTHHPTAALEITSAIND